VLSAGLVGACASEDAAGNVVRLPDRVTSTSDPGIAGSAIEAFGFDLLAAVSASVDVGENVVISPVSIAVALGMLEPGATGAGQGQLRSLLRITDAATWHASINALTADLESRRPGPVGTGVGEGQNPGEVTVRIANAAFTQPGYPFLPEYLAVVGSNYGAVIEQLDFATDRYAAAERINGFVAERTDGHIQDLVSGDQIDPATVLALVNALLLQASWESEFLSDATTDQAFTLRDGSTVTVPMMLGGSDRSAAGPQWVAASKSLIGQLRLDVVLPDRGQFDAVAASFGEIVEALTTSLNPGGQLGIPRFETRVSTELNPVLQSLGLVAPYGPANLLGIAGDPDTTLDQVLHQSWLSIDESGIEAAAATLILVVATSAPSEPPIPVILDRPFLFRIVDTVSGAPLFSGRVMNPTT
jgi:serpin B